MRHYTARVGWITRPNTYSKVIYSSFITNIGFFLFYWVLSYRKPFELISACWAEWPNIRNENFI